MLGWLAVYVRTVRRWPAKGESHTQEQRKSEVHFLFLFHASWNPQVRVAYTWAAGQGMKEGRDSPLGDTECKTYFSPLLVATPFTPSCPL